MTHPQDPALTSGLPRITERPPSGGPPETKTSSFCRLLQLILPHSAATNETMRTMVVVFILALISIGFEIYSDAALTSAEISHAAPDPVSAAIGHGLKRG